MDEIAADPAADHEPTIGSGREDDVSPVDVAGFTSRLERLLALARAQQIDLAALSLPDLVEQLGVALQHASGRTDLGLQCDWMVMAAWLLLLRSRLLLRVDTATQAVARGKATRLRRGLLALQDTQAAARWLEARQQLGRDVFPVSNRRSSASPTLRRTRWTSLSSCGRASPVRRRSDGH